MLLLRHNSDLDASSFRLRSSTYPSYGTIPSKQFTHSPPEEVLSNYVHTTLPSQPPFSMYSSSLHDQREESLVDPWPSAAGVSQPTEISSTLSKPTVTYSPSSHAVSSTTPLNDSSRHPRFVHTPGGSPSARHQSFPSHPTSLNRHVSEPNIRSVAAQPAPHYPLSNPAETRYQQQRRPQHRRSFQHSVTPAIPSPSSASFSADRRPSTAGSAASSGWELEARGDMRSEPLQEVASVTPSHGVYASIGILVDPSK